MKKKNIKESQIAEVESNNEESSSKDFNTSSFESNLETSFFYTNDRFINQIDNNEMFQYIQTKYPNISLEHDDSIIKKQLTQFLNDENFVQYILQYYNLTIFEFFSMLYKQFSTIFKGPYLKKLKNVIAGKKYITNARKKRDY